MPHSVATHLSDFTHQAVQSSCKFHSKRRRGRRGNMLMTCTFRTNPPCHRTHSRQVRWVVVASSTCHSSAGGSSRRSRGLHDLVGTH